MEYLNLPSVPQSIIDECKHIANNFDIEAYCAHRRNALQVAPRPWNTREWHDGKLSYYFDFENPQPYCDFFVIASPQSLKDWVKENIHPCPLLISIQLMEGGLRVVPHTDYIRKYALNYLISDAGPETVLYKPKQEYSHLEIFGGPSFEYNRLDIVERAVIEQYKWHLLDVSSIHSVENILQPRLAITISFDALPIF
jgi:hypothetical protein